MVLFKVAYILDPRYQALDPGYGNIRTGPRKYFSMGWSVHLPGLCERQAEATLLMRAEMMARFPATRKSTWLRETMETLDHFQTAEGRWKIPSKFLREGDSYYVMGCRMGLGENRRKRTSMEVESTFRMLRLLTLGM
jgi:hypothetical protein